MKKKLKSLILSAIICITSIPFSEGITVNASPYIFDSEYYNREIDWEMWDKFLKYDLCITDYDALTAEEQELCKFIFETERSSYWGVICERARRTLAGYDVGKRITFEQAQQYHRIADRNTYYNSYYDGEEQTEHFNSTAVLQCVPDIRHLYFEYEEYWLDDEGTKRIIVDTEKQTYYNYKYKDNDYGFEYYTYTPETKELETIESGGCVYAIYPDGTAMLIELTDKTTTSISIPRQVSGHLIVEIGVHAFSSSAVTDVKLPSTLKYIAPYAFYDCAQLVNINFPKELEFIGGFAFDKCTSLGDVIIDCPQLNLGVKVFAGMKAKSIYLNVPSINYLHYLSTDQFESLTFGNEVKEIAISFIKSGCEFPPAAKIIFDSESYYGNKSITIPPTIEVIGKLGEKIYIGAYMDSMYDPLTNETCCMFDADCVINGWYNTEAHRYALEWGLKFNPMDEDVAYGDTNLDGEISMADMVLLQSYLKGNISEIGYEADLMEDGIIDAFDMIRMRKMMKN